MTDARITVTGAGSLFGQGILKSLRCSSLDLSIQGLDYFADAFGFRLCDTTGLLPDFLRPDVSEDSWLAALTSEVTRHQADLLFVGTDFEVGPLARARGAIEAATGCRIIVASPQMVALCKDKLATAQHLDANGLRVPKSFPASIGFDAAAGHLGTPFIVKPRRGARSQGVTVVETRYRFDAAVEERDDMMVQYCLPDADGEYSCGVLVLGGQVVAVAPLRRELRDGNTWSAVSLGPDDLQSRSVASYCMDVAAVLGAEGPINVQCRLLDGAPVAFEINPRFSGTTYFRTLLGLNEPERVVLHHLGRPVPEAGREAGAAAQPRAGRVRRFFDECLEPL